MDESRANQQIGYLLRSYPRFSQTFVLNEILALEQAGVPIQIFAMTRAQEEIIQSQVSQIRAPVRYLSETSGGPPFQSLRKHARVLQLHPAGYLRALFYAVSRPEIDHGYTTASRMECFGMAVSLVHQLGSQDRPPIQHLHAHFAHDPTFIAQLVHLISGIPYSFTAHARDLFQVGRNMLAERIEHASAVITCCQNNLRYLAQVSPTERGKFSMIYHGVDLQRFQPPAGPKPRFDPPLILSIGRLVEKKGFFDLLEALQRVKEGGGRFQCRIYGDGPLRAAIAQQITGRGLGGWVTLAGSITQQELLPVFQSADLFVLTPTVTDDGDRDGIPNVLVEAMAVGLPVISTTTAGIPELVTHEVNGLLYPPHDIEGIASGIAVLLCDPVRRDRLGRAARPRVIEHFDLARAALQLKTLFSQAQPLAEIGELFHARL